MSFLLDVTLRDGGYQNQFQFLPAVAGAVARDLGAAGVNYIEIGYKKGSLKPIPGIGPSGLCEASYVQAVRRAAPQAKLAVMVHPHNIELQDLEELRALGVEMIRVCINQKDLNSTGSVIAKAKELGFITTANITRVTYLEINQILALAEFSEAAGADVVYFADTMGNMIPEDVTAVTKVIRDAVRIPVGFHAHNNLSLALANSIAAEEAGATYIDSSLKGMGKGAGNLATEVYAAYRHRRKLDGALNVAEILEIAQKWEQSMKDFLANPSTEELFLGAGNFSADFASVLREVSQNYGVPWTSLALAVSENAPKVVRLPEILLVASRLKTKRESINGQRSEQSIA